MNHVVIVTGGGRGLGRAFAVALARNHWRVAIASRTLQELNATVELIRAEGAEATAIPADVTDQRDVGNLVSVAEEKLGPIDLLVNCAGVGAPYGPFWETAAAEWWRNVEVNLKGPVLCCQAVIKGMIARRCGRIVNVSSGVGTASFANMSAYVTSKTALIRFTEVAADELRPFGVAVFAIHPGTVRTAMTEDVLHSAAGRKWLPWFGDIFKNKQDVTSQPAEELVLYLASGKADALSGRFFSAPFPHHQTDRIVKENLNVLRLRT